MNFFRATEKSSEWMKWSEHELKHSKNGVEKLWKKKDIVQYYFNGNYVLRLLKNWTVFDLNDIKREIKEFSPEKFVDTNCDWHFGNDDNNNAIWTGVNIASRFR